ncbi:MAG: hypothetical protein MJY58_06900 [Bacteroidaceae bacterium]|nr:hypothetical protein [Bacteroidaceae bacterium]
MAETPFPFKHSPYRDRWECPSVHASADGIVWRIPQGGKNPIDDLTDEGIDGYDFFSDPDLVIRDGELECWYRMSLRKGEINITPKTRHILYRKKTVDGISWSEREEMLDISKKFGREIVSPSLIYENGYRMWAVDYSAPADKVLYMFCDVDGTWRDIHHCKLSGHSCSPWHIDVSFFDGFYWLVVYEKTEIISLWKSKNGTTFDYVTDLLDNQHIDGSFDELGYYRASLVKVSDKDYRLYFSAVSFSSTHIGLLRGDDVLNMHIVNCSDGKFCSFWGWIWMYVNKIKERILAIRYDNNINRVFSCASTRKRL